MASAGDGPDHNGSGQFRETEGKNALGGNGVHPLDELNVGVPCHQRSNTEDQAATMQPPSRPSLNPRQRGYSLRRQLFSSKNKSTTHHEEEQVELQDAPSFGQNNGDSRRPVFRYDLPKYPISYGEKMRQNAQLPAFTQRFVQMFQQFRRRLRLTSRQSSVNVLSRTISIDPTRSTLLVDERTNSPYCNNLITSSRYSMWSFLPRQIVFQFSKVANFYFLIIAIMQMIPGWSTTGNYTTIIPLSFFLSLAIAREGYDDYRRHQQDKVENFKRTRVFKPMTGVDSYTTINKEQVWADTIWYDVRVGDIVRVDKDEWVPADLLLLHSTGINGGAFLESAALDGETNLKNRSAIPIISKHCTTVAELISLRATLTCEHPNQDLYNFQGRLEIDGQVLPLSNNDIIYRGTILRNTPFIFGLVIFSGEESKIRMNASRNLTVKAPSLQRLANYVVYMVVCVVIAMAIACTVANRIWRGSVEEASWYLVNARIGVLPIFTSFIIMFNTMIPLSLYVTMEIIKVVQMIFLQWDVDMYHEESNTPAEAHTATLNEELGQVKYIFSDKTGTLTENIMVFRKLSVAGYAWVHDYDIKQAAVVETRKRLLTRRKKKEKAAVALGRSKSITGYKNETMSPLEPQRTRSLHVEDGIVTYSSVSRFDDLPPSNQNSLSAAHDPQPNFQWRSSAIPAKPQPSRTTSDLLRYLQSNPHTLYARRVRLFILSIALCHTGIPSFDREDGDYAYQASSPDEIALINCAKELGYVLIDRDLKTIKIQTRPGSVGNVIEEYQVLHIIEFSSNRKRMSIIARFPDGRICLICKGADSVITKRLRLSALASMKAKAVERSVTLRRNIGADLAAQAQHKASNMGESKLPLVCPSMSTNRSGVIRDLDDWLKIKHLDVFGQISFTNEGEQISPDNPASRHSYAFGERNVNIEPTEGVTIDIDDQHVADDNAVFEACFQHIDDFSTDGLRTLIYGYRYISEDEFQQWTTLYNDACSSLSDRDRMVEAAGEIIEKNLELCGVTAIEDKLQEGVPEAIDKLRRAHIKLWMLTGDKRETAINIGHSCRLIKDYSKVFIMASEGRQELADAISAARIALDTQEIAHSVVVVDGGTLGVVESDYTLFEIFLELCMVVDSVILCRASPSQKALLVRSVRNQVKHTVTLAIGDGANDIAMIQEANVGIGITGREGLQAARSSDYSIAQFRFLLKLLLVHGRWNYVRLSKYILATFWKELFFYLTQAIYQSYVGWTGTSLMEQWSLSMFNTLFTSLPVLVIGIFEKDLSPTTLLAMPESYEIGQRNMAFSIKIYFGWMFIAVSQSVIVYFVCYYMFGIRDTTAVGIFALGDLVYTCCVIIICLKIQFLEMAHWSLVNVISALVTIGGWFSWNIILNFIYAQNGPYVVKSSFVTRLGRDWVWWCAAMASIVVALAFDLTVSVVRRSLFPTSSDVLHELEHDSTIKARFLDESASEMRQSRLRLGAELSPKATAMCDEDGIFKGWRQSFSLTNNKHSSSSDTKPSSEIRTTSVEVRPPTNTSSEVPTAENHKPGPHDRKPFKRLHSEYISK